jgi:hypothetical protein
LPLCARKKEICGDSPLFDGYNDSVMALRGYILLLVVGATSGVRADELLYRYEGDVHPCADPDSGWICGGCTGACSESVENGKFVLRWECCGGRPAYHYTIAQYPELPPPPPFWLEWRFRSDHPWNLRSTGCDAAMQIQYMNVFDVLFLFGDTIISFSGDDVRTGLPLNEFHTFRFETSDGSLFCYWVDGQLFLQDVDASGDNGFNSFQFRGDSGCSVDTLPKINEWDYVRYGRLESGEKIIAAEPPSGFHDPSYFTARDRFAVTFDTPNYVYVDDITVEVTGGIAPHVIATRRRDQDGPESLEIVLDRPPPPNHTTRFIFDDGVVQNVVRYTLQYGDTNGDGLIDMRDAAALQNCFGVPLSSASGTPPELIDLCLALEATGDGVVTDEDAAYFLNFLFAGALP